jgi:hypothetical protein
LIRVVFKVALRFLIATPHLLPPDCPDLFPTNLPILITMDEQVDRLVKKTWAKFQEVPRSKRLMIAVSGIPGSGEISTFTVFCYTRLTALQAKQLSHPS